MLPRTGDNSTPIGNSAAAINFVNHDKLPTGFPTAIWNTQNALYADRYSWWNSDPLYETKGKTTEGEIVYRFPLHLNPLREVVLKHAQFLLGSVPDLPSPQVKPLYMPMPPMDGSKAKAADIKLTKLAYNATMAVWNQSNPRSLLVDQAATCQFAGGCVFQLVWLEDDSMFQLPLRIQSISPDYFLPVWANGNYDELLEVYVAYYITSAAARAQYGVEPTTNPYCLYVEHWTKDKYSCYVNNEPIKDRLGKEMFELDNPFGLIPFEYIPHVRVASFYGQSHVDDMKGLIKELNARLADEGMIIRTTSQRRRIMRNVTGKVKEWQAAKGYWVLDIGSPSPAFGNAQPEIKTEDPPVIPPNLSAYSEKMHNYINRTSFLNNMGYGEDEGSQRSGETLVLRLLPTTMHADMERMNWTDGLNRLDIKMLLMLARHPASPLKGKIPLDIAKRVSIAQEWSPHVPRDRAQLTNEMSIRTGGKSTISRKHAMQQLGDVRDVEEEEALILAEEDAELALIAKYAPAPADGATPGGIKTDTKPSNDVKPPTAQATDSPASST